MNIVDELLKADVKKAEDVNKSVFKSSKLANIIGSKEPVDVEIKEISPRRLTDILGYQLDKNGKMDYSKLFDAKLMTCIEGVTSPDMKDKELQKHFECGSAKELIEKLFGSEVNELSDAIASLSGIGGNNEDEIKNS